MASYDWNAALQLPCLSAGRRAAGGGRGRRCRYLWRQGESLAEVRAAAEGRACSVGLPWSMDVCRVVMSYLLENSGRARRRSFLSFGIGRSKEGTQPVDPVRGKAPRIIVVPARGRVTSTSTGPLLGIPAGGMRNARPSALRFMRGGGGEMYIQCTSILGRRFLGPCTQRRGRSHVRTTPVAPKTSAVTAQRHRRASHVSSISYARGPSFLP